MTMTKFVTANFKLGHVRFQNRVARHVPEDAGIFSAAFQPWHYLGRANVFHEVRLVPTLADAFGLRKVVRRPAVSIGKLKVEIIHQTEIAEYLEHERKARDRQQPSGFRAAVVMAMH